VVCGLVLVQGVVCYWLMVNTRVEMQLQPV
jgi:hypothetical protein